MSNDTIMFKGKKLESCSKEELIEAIHWLFMKNLSLYQEKKHEREMLLSLRR